ncbi:MAG: ferritin-like domain-containing protein [Calditrichaeota bacterium]|nr:ferritin-like domain-containing protein [Calditrichota bacterium]
MKRRDFINTISFAGISSGLILSSCETTNDSTSEENLENDLQIVTDGAIFEASGVATYAAAANSGLLVDQAVIDTAVLFMNQHQQHLDELNALLQFNNLPTFSADSADPVAGTENVTNQQDIILLAMEVEFEAANFYFRGLTQTLSNSIIRKTFANILPVEMAHAVTYKNVLGQSPAINSGLFEEFSINS